MVGLGLFTTACYYDNAEDLYQFVIEEDCTATEATFNADIAPLLQTHCNRCHRNDRQDGNVNLEGYDQVKPYADNALVVPTIYYVAVIPNGRFSGKTGWLT